MCGKILQAGFRQAGSIVKDKDTCRSAAFQGKPASDLECSTEVIGSRSQGRANTKNGGEVSQKKKPLQELVKVEFIVSALAFGILAHQPTGGQRL